ncbi:uncharacterized protein LOC135945869 [Cloeon dipterum]|uniref:uncharacterized protein LOC135945869 n=1 Tax=Cloeon dipterum TaxID=197152 RepID=UPI00321FCB18
MLLLLLLLLSCGAGWALPAGPLGSQGETVFAVLATCMRTDGNQVLTCLQERAVRAWDQALSFNGPVELLDGIVTLEKDNNETAVQAVDLAGSSIDLLPADPAARSFQLNDMLMQRLKTFFQQRTLKIVLPLSEQGRGKLKKYAEPLVMAIMWKVMMASLGMGALALLAGKALLVSKLALTLSLLMAMRRLLNGGGGGLEKIDIFAKHYEEKKHQQGDSSHIYPSFIEPDAYYGHKRSFQPMPAKTAELLPPFSSAPALDINNNVYADREYAQIKAAAGRQRGFDPGTVLRRSPGNVQKLDKS